MSYLFAGVVQCITITGIPFGIQSFKLCATIIGIPLGLGNFKMIPLALAPFSKDIVRNGSGHGQIIVSS